METKRVNVTVDVHGNLVFRKDIEPNYTIHNIYYQREDYLSFEHVVGQFIVKSLPKGFEVASYIIDNVEKNIILKITSPYFNYELKIFEHGDMLRVEDNNENFIGFYLSQKQYVNTYKIFMSIYEESLKFYKISERNLERKNKIEEFKFKYFTPETTISEYSKFWDEYENRQLTGKDIFLIKPDDNNFHYIYYIFEYKDGVITFLGEGYENDYCDFIVISVTTKEAEIKKCENKIETLKALEQKFNERL